MSHYIQAKLQYAFADEQLLYAALRSAHREKDDDVLDDGNRGLAHYGNLAMQMAMTHETIIEKRKTLHDIHAQNHWSKTKKGRAKACKLLGIEPFITRSVRQQNQALSDTVLDHALSAVLGAIWLDGECQEYKISKIRSTILEVLKSIDVFMDESLATPGDALGTDQALTNHPEGCLETMGLGQVELDDVERFTREWFEQEFDGFSLKMLPHRNIALDVQPSAGKDGRAASFDRQFVDETDVSDPSSSNGHPAYERSGAGHFLDGSSYERPRDTPFGAQRKQAHLFLSQDTSNDVATTVKRPSRKRSRDEEERRGSVYQRLLQAERQKLTRVARGDHESLIRYLEHPMLDKLDKKASTLARFLYLAIGSWETIVDFKDVLHLARSDPNVCRQPNLLSGNAPAMYNEICRLEKEETLCVIFRRYYIVQLCEEEQLYNDHHDHIFVETPITVGGDRVTKPGNPVFALESSLTERLLLKIMPDTDPGSGKFKKARSKVKRLRKLAGRLRFLVKRYGFGILGLLPSGPSFEQMSLTDSMLLSMTQANFDKFLKLLDEEQGQHLMILSAFIESSLTALVTGSSNSDTSCLPQLMDVSLLSDLPKGLIRRGLPPRELYI